MSDFGLLLRDKLSSEPVSKEKFFALLTRTLFNIDIHEFEVRYPTKCVDASDVDKR